MPGPITTGWNMRQEMLFCITGTLKYIMVAYPSGKGQGRSAVYGAVAMEKLPSPIRSTVLTTWSPISPHSCGFESGYGTQWTRS